MKNAYWVSGYEVGPTMTELNLVLAGTTTLLLCVLGRQWWLRRRAKRNE